MTNSKWSICPTCEGEGTVVNPNIDAQGLTREDFDDDPDFAEDYMSGVYNISCRTCGGSGKVKDVDEVIDRLHEASEERRLAAREDGDFEAYCYEGDYRYGY